MTTTAKVTLTLEDCYAIAPSAVPYPTVVCRFCGQRKQDRHKPSCKLEAALLAEGESPAAPTPVSAILLNQVEDCRIQMEAIVAKLGYLMSAGHAALSSAPAAPAQNELDVEIARWQKAIYELLCANATDENGIDGGGEDSGDPLDFTLCEIRQLIGQLKDAALSTPEVTPEFTVKQYGHAGATCDTAKSPEVTRQPEPPRIKYEDLCDMCRLRLHEYQPAERPAAVPKGK